MNIPVIAFISIIVLSIAVEFLFSRYIKFVRMSDQINDLKFILRLREKEIANLKLTIEAYQSIASADLTLLKSKNYRIKRLENLIDGLRIFVDES